MTSNTKSFKILYYFSCAELANPTSEENNGDGSGSSSTCRFNVNSYKMMWIMDSENCLYKKKCLTKAQQVGGFVLFSNREWKETSV